MEVLYVIRTQPQPTATTPDAIFMRSFGVQVKDTFLRRVVA